MPVPPGGSSKSRHVSRLTQTKSSCSQAPSGCTGGLGLELPAVSTAAEARGLSVNAPDTACGGLLWSSVKSPGSHSLGSGSAPVVFLVLLQRVLALGKDSSGLAKMFSETSSLVDLTLGSKGGRAFNLLLRLVRVSSFSRDLGEGLPASSSAPGSPAGPSSVPGALQPRQNKEINTSVMGLSAFWLTGTKTSKHSFTK